MKKKENKDQLGQRLRAISAELKHYFEKRIELVMLNVGEYLSAWMAASIQRVTGGLLLLVGVCFLFIALALYLGDLLGSQSLGFVLVSLPLLLVGVLFVYLRPKSMFEQLQNSFEAEVIKAIEQSGKADQKKIESADTRSSKISEG